MADRANSPRDCGATGLPAGNFIAIDRLEYLPSAILGIFTHYVEPALRLKLHETAHDLRLAEDLGLDSLSLMEVMIRVEDLLHVTINDRELREFHTVGDVLSYIERKVRDVPAVAAAGPDANFAAN